MKEIFEYAKIYLNFGWSVVPCAKDKKYPFVSWQKYQVKQPTHFDWLKWRQHALGIGLVTGKLSGIVVVDIDSKNKFGLKSPVVCKTQSGGYHFYYKWTEKINNAVKIDGSPIDFKSDGGFVMLPPTSYKSKYYKWLKIPTKLTPVPEKIKKFLVISEKEIKKSIVCSKLVGNADICGIKKGQRNEKLHRYALFLCNKYPEQEWDTKVLPQLYEVSKTFDPPFTKDEKDVETVYKSACDFIRRNPKKSYQELNRNLEKDIKDVFNL